MPHKSDTQLTAAAGEHLVLSRLLARGALAAPAPRGAKTVDLLVAPTSIRPAVLVQVKSRKLGKDGGWHMNKKHEEDIRGNLFFCFVDFEPQYPTVHVMHSKTVADILRNDYSIWLATPGAKGQKRKETAFRRLRPAMQGAPRNWMEPHLEAWHLIVPQQES